MNNPLIPKNNPLNLGESIAMLILSNSSRAAKEDYIENELAAKLFPFNPKKTGGGHRMPPLVVYRPPFQAR